MSDSEANLLARCRQGRGDAWKELFEKYYGLVCRFVAQMHPSFRHEDIEEIAQETFLAIVRGLADYKGSSQFITWIYRIAANKSRDYWSKQQAAKRGGGQIHVSLDAPPPIHSESQDSPSAPQIVAPGASPDQAAMQLEQMNLVRNGLDQLGDPCREILELRYFGDLCYEDIAKVLDVNEKTVSSRLSRCLDALADVISKGPSVGPQSRSGNPGPVPV